MFSVVRFFLDLKILKEYKKIVRNTSHWPNITKVIFRCVFHSKKDIIFIQGSFFDISSRCNILILTSAFEAFKITRFCNTSYYPISVLKSFILCLITKSGTKKLGLSLLYFKAWGDKSVIYGSIQKERCYKWGRVRLNLWISSILDDKTFISCSIYHITLIL